MQITGIERVKVDSANEEDGVKKKARQAPCLFSFCKDKKKQSK